MNHDVNVKVDTSALDSKFQQVKKHFRENKKTYLAGIGGVFIGAVVCRRMPGAKSVVDSYKLQFNSPTTNVVTTELIRRGHPGFIVRNKTTGEVFASQARAAAMDRINPAILSLHLNGKLENAGGSQYERIQEAQ